MERDGKSIEEIIDKIIFLLLENNERGWANCLKSLSNEFRNSNKSLQSIKDILKIYEGGMGSFTDLVLQKDYKMLVEENNQLANLKGQLYNKCLQYFDEQKAKGD